MIKTPLSTVIGGAFWTPGCTVMGGQKTLTQLIKSLFSLGDQGFAYDPNDLTTLYQDAAGTIPVTAQGQPVGLMKDKSGRNNHAYQTVSASRPILQRNATTGAYYLAFDGADDFLQTSNIDFTSTNKVSLFAGVRKLSDAARAIVCELGAAGKNTFLLQAPPSAGSPTVSFNSGATILSGDNVGGVSAPVSLVLTAKSDIANDYITIVANNSANTPVISDQGAGNYGNYPLYIGRRGGTSIPFNGHIYGIICIGKLVSDSETTAIEKELAKRLGVTLNV